MSRQGLWRHHLGMVVVWCSALWLLYIGMEYWLEPKEAVVQADGSLQLQRQRDGHFYADGLINGQPVRFLVDTGASVISVSDEVAQRAGLSGGEEAIFHTANGSRTGRLVRAQQIQVGPLRVSQLTVGTGYTGKTPQDALLGQNFLRHFDVLMRGDTMLLHPRAGG